MTDTTQGNVYLQLMQTEEAQRRQSMLATLADAIDTNPDQAAVQHRVARYMGYAPAVAAATPRDSEREAKLKEIDTGTSNAPVLRRRYSDADFARLAHDDHSILSQIESHVGAVTRFAMGANAGGPTLVGQAVKGAVNDGAKGLAGAFRALFDVVAPVLDPLENVTAIGGNPLRRVAEGFAESARTPVFTEEKITRPMGLIEAGVVSGLRSFGAQALPLPMSLIADGKPAALGG